MKKETKKLFWQAVVFFLILLFAMIGESLIEYLLQLLGYG
jgi:hypothetical protein